MWKLLINNIDSKNCVTIGVLSGLDLLLSLGLEPKSPGGACQGIKLKKLKKYIKNFSS